ncbi:hypothetical protein D9611_004018 [Ephemerocybe angulata]|uniref:Uncharacterized protein n=1 Tax=Ephemerocybe angulata TaxID=980116 RepID=A0A8H5B5U0_9AGAR|nr:hypothetical protein D9611_004018 [Tulosesus angulatus]
MSSPTSTLKGVAVIGDGAVGKTSLLIRGALGKCPDPEVYIPTVANNYCIAVAQDGSVGEADDDTMASNVVKLCVYDTAGQEDYLRLRPMAYANAHVILICFAVDDPESLNNVVDKASNKAVQQRNT